MILYLDTSHHLVLGLLDEKDGLKWCEYLVSENKKSASTFHQTLWSLLSQHSLKALELTCIIHAAGPGSYTGVRLAEGIAQIFKLFNVAVYSFFHYEIPRLLGHREGAWICNAFKGECFIYNWKLLEGEEVSQHFFTSYQESQKLLKEGQFKNKIFTHFLNNLRPSLVLVNEDNSTLFFEDIQETEKLIFANAPTIFPKIIGQNWQRNPFYFRPLELEFKPIYQVRVDERYV